jgi:D-alanyl-lipoteichoic acid acyltransferase DltB (MBOAT superfamily)
LFQFFDLFHFKRTINIPLIELILPLGLSYYVFQTIGYTLDVYRGSSKAEKNFSQFTLFTLFFPKLLVGPIERANHLIPQLKRKIYYNNENIIEGSKRIAWGLFKKLVVADRISIYHASVIGSSQFQSGGTILLACVLYTFQVYADFSGYTDIAIGSARMFGFDLMENFKRPLLAKSVSEFWRRWHISLSSWVNDYIFNPLVFKNRDWGIWGIFYGLIISFVVIGIWHGAAWNYVIFGLLQAIALIYEVITRKARKRISHKLNTILYNTISILVTFSFVTFSLIIFQSTTFNEAINIVERIFINNGPLFYDKPSTLLFMSIGCAILILVDSDREFSILKFSLFSNNNWLIQQVSYALLLIYILLAGVFDGGQFIYFSF